MFWRMTAIALASAMMIGSAAAQIVGVGTSKGGTNQQIGVAIASIVSKHSDLQMRPTPYAGMEVFIPIVDSGELDFGVGNTMQLALAKSGKIDLGGDQASEGERFKNLRLVATLMPVRFGFIVPKNSGINSIADLKGKRVPYGYSAAPLFDVLFKGALAYGGLTYDDVVRVPVAGVRQARDLFKQGQTDVEFPLVGSAIVSEMNASIPGGIKFLSFEGNGDAGVKRMLAEMPSTYIEEVQPAPGFVGIEGPTKLAVYDYLLWTGSHVDDKVVASVAKALYENADELKATGAVWNSMQPDKMGKHQDIAYHSGAKQYYESIGIYGQ